MFQAQAMLFDFQKLLVKREDLGRTFRASRGKLVLSVGENLFQMTGHCGFPLSILESRFANGVRSRSALVQPG